MVKCQNCGNINTLESNFCRFCGTKFVIAPPMPQQQTYDYSPPRPYAWKTDEFQTQNEPRRRPAEQRPAPVPIDNQSYQQPITHWQGNAMQQAYLCQRCMNRFPPRYERRVSTAGWIVFAVLLVTFFPLFWIGLLIKEDVWVCQACNARMT
jgi:hypothetical protein